MATRTKRIYPYRVRMTWVEEKSGHLYEVALVAEHTGPRSKCKHTERTWLGPVPTACAFPAEV